jgi:hypothetical protein
VRLAQTDALTNSKVCMGSRSHDFDAELFSIKAVISMAGAMKLKTGADLISELTCGSVAPVDDRMFSTLSLKRRRSPLLTVW